MYKTGIKITGTAANSPQVTCVDPEIQFVDTYTATLLVCVNELTQAHF